MTKFAERLFELREENKVTMEVLAEYLKVNKSTISKWERKKSTPNIDYAYQIALYFNVSCDFLLGLEDN